MRMRMRLWPDSIFGRFLAVLVISCALAQIVATSMVVHRSGSLVLRREQPIMDGTARRIADTLQRFRSLTAAERTAALAEIEGRPIDLGLGRLMVMSDAPPPPERILPRLLQVVMGLPPPPRPLTPQVRADELLRRIRSLLGADIDLEARIVPLEPDDMPGPPHAPRTFGSLRMPEAGLVSLQGPAAGLPGPHWRATFVRDTALLITATWPGEPPLTFQVPFTTAAIRRAPLSFTTVVGLQLAGQLLVLLIGVSFGAYVAARRITSPLSRLAAAADSLGRSLCQPPLPETGPRELRQVAQGFNVMQDRLRRYIDSRTRVVAAMSHDLRTPLTRARLRLEMMQDDDNRREFEHDLTEMEGMVLATLDALSDVGAEEATQPVDIDELLERLRVEFAQLGRHLTIEGRTRAPCCVRPQALKRCLTNLIDNAFKYGDAAHIGVRDGDWLCIVVADDGPGIPADELERVFEPFYRLESSRSRETGGAGLGLSVARDAAQAHGGRLILRNGRVRGLEAELILPRAGGRERPGASDSSGVCRP